MENIKPYNKYKSSGIAWLGDIPEHWSHSKLKYLTYKIVDGAHFTPTYVEHGIPFLRVTDIQTKKINLSKIKYIPLEEHNELIKRCNPKKGDVLLSKNGTIGITKIIDWDFDFSIFVSLCLIKLRPILNPYFFSTLFSSKAVEVQIKESGQTTSVTNLHLEKIRELICILPPIKEQIAIADFLDYKLSKIDRFISKKKQIIKLLNEQKAGIINHAVTKGLDPIATMKDSGIEWLGEIPEHWIVRKIGRSIKGIGSGTTPLSSNTHFYENGTINWINSGDLNDNLVYECKKQITQKAFNETSSLKKFPKGTLTVAMYGATIGKVGLLQIEATTNQACCNIPINSFYDTKFLMYWFMGNRKHIINLSYGGGQPNISQDTIKSLHIPCTSIEEQQAIVEHIEKETSKLITTIQTIEKEIALTQEYRTALIAEAVTGKIDVRAFVIPTVSVQEELYEEIEEELDMVAEDAESYENE
jgi:type I restriction enzyme S subunit